MPSMTPDIEKLRETLPTLEPIIDRLELQLVDDPGWNEPSDTSYLSEADRQNPDIAANVEAMAETNKLIAWFGRDAEGYLGLWCGPNNRSLTEAPVVRLDTEGQYSIVAATVPEYLAIAMPEDEFAHTRDALTKAGFKVGFNPDAIWGALDAFDDDPNAFRNELYERARVARGMTRTDEDEDEGDTGGVPEETELASGSVPSLPISAAQPGNDDDFDDDDDDGAGEVADSDDGGDEDDDEDDDEDESPPPLAAKQPAKQAATKPVKTAAAKPAKKAAAKKAAAKPVKKAAAKPAKKAAGKPAKKAAGKAAKPAQKAAAKPAKKAAGKAAVKKATKPAKKKRK
jgi:hypothetical protein